MGTPTSQTPRRGRTHRRWTAVIFTVATLVRAIVMRRRGYRFGVNVAVRCRDGHLYTTIWIPGASIKALRFGRWRFQHCPVGRHWSLVTLVKEAVLTDEQLRTAREQHDIWLP